MKRYKNSKNLFKAATALSVVAVSVVPGVVSASQFTDIQGNTHEGAIIELVGKGLIKGYPDGTFKPNKTLTRSDVVKLLGKYLIANGYKIPADYKTKMRFADLSPNSNEELLQYAALVKDEGIFNGDQGKLNPSGTMTRENMAVVLVKVLSTIHEFDYISYIESKQIDTEIKDLLTAKPAAQSAINVLNFYHVTSVDTFNPKGSTTRGQFASFLNKLIKIDEPLAVVEVKILSKDELSVKLSDETIYTVPLTKPLTENTKETVEFSIDGIQYNAVVEYIKQEEIPQEENPNTVPDPDQAGNDDSTEGEPTGTYKVKSDELLLGVSTNGSLVEVDDANVEVFGLVDGHEVELPSSAYTITTDSDYLTINGSKVTANFSAISADGILDNDNDQYEVDITITINESGETIHHTLTLTREEAQPKNNFKLIDKNSLSKKALNDIEIDISETDSLLTTQTIFDAILSEGYFEIEDQYGATVDVIGNTGEVRFANGKTDYIRLIIRNINTLSDKTVVSGNGTNNVTLTLGEDALTEGDSFDAVLTIDEVSLTVKVYIR